ncbi:MAG: glucose-6-phosphate isomerase [Clostridiales bacterium]|nr:glucose-6-phosphate isomerase [Clostridiales bacterium]
MEYIKFDYKSALDFMSEDEIFNKREFVKTAHEILSKGTGAGSDFLGWLRLPLDYDREEYKRVKACVQKIRSDSEILIVIGIGGSYLGSRAAIEMLGNSFYNLENLKNGKNPLILFAGNNISSTYMTDLLDFIKDRDISVNVISKSGTTTEPALAFRIFKAHMEKKYGRVEAAKRIYATTDKARGALKSLSDSEGYETFVIPDNVGGRYSVLTPVGLLPIGVAGADTDKILEGAAAAYEKYLEPDVNKNHCYAYAAARNVLCSKGKNIEIMVNYEPGLHYFTEWWKQLYGESEGKDHKGIFPVGVDFTTDLHSMGQYIQDGMRNIFETVIKVDKPRRNCIVEKTLDNGDGLNFLAGMDIDLINKKAAEGTLLAHTDGGVPNLSLTVPALDENGFGQMVYFFEKACGISGYLLGVNPFDQPGVEEYKKNMYRLLGKPGYGNK